MEEYFDEEPYLFKDCHSTYALAVAHANFFKGGQIKLPVSIRKRGKWVNVIIHQINVKTAECDTHEKIVIEPFLTPEYLGKIPKDRMFGGIVAYTKEGNTNIIIIINNKFFFIFPSLLCFFIKLNFYIQLQIGIILQLNLNQLLQILLHHMLLIFLQFFLVDLNLLHIGIIRLRLQD